MDCKYKDSLVPRCKIVTHPDRPNVEYCKLCGEWDYLNHIGGVFPPRAANVWWFIVAAGLMMFILRASLFQENPSYYNGRTPAQSARESTMVVHPDIAITEDKVMEDFDPHSSLFRLACKALKYFSLALFGLTLFCIMSSGLGALDIAVLMLTSLGAWIGRLAVLIVGFLSAAVVYESLRQ